MEWIKASLLLTDEALKYFQQRRAECNSAELLHAVAMFSLWKTCSAQELLLAGAVPRCSCEFGPFGQQGRGEREDKRTWKGIADLK